jgi:catechol 2,3-dioxygenase-like lactoylglutathione lyase family enzyme
MKRFDHGTLSRRELMQGLALLTGASTTAFAGSQDTGFRASSIHHVSIRVSDLQRSADWYRKTFRLTDFSPPQKDLVQLGLGKSNLSLRVGNPAGRIDHFALGIGNSTEAAVLEGLRQRGVNVTRLQASDPDGLNVHLALDDPS